MTDTSATTNLGKVSPLEQSERAVRAFLKEQASYDAAPAAEQFLESIFGATHARPRYRKARENLYATHKKLIAVIAKHYSCGDQLARSFQETVPREWTYRLGEGGLHNAIRLFGPPRDYRFSTYAVWWIRKDILQAREGTEENEGSSVYEDGKGGILYSDDFVVRPSKGYKNKNDEEVRWGKLTTEEKKGVEESERREAKAKINKDIKENFSEFVRLLSTGMEIPEHEATRELEALIAAEK